MNTSDLRNIIKDEIKKTLNENVERDMVTMKRGIKNVTNNILSSLDSLDIDTLQNLSAAINRAADIVKPSPLSKSTFQDDPRGMEVPSRGDWRGKTSPSA